MCKFWVYGGALHQEALSHGSSQGAACLSALCSVPTVGAIAPTTPPPVCEPWRLTVPHEQTKRLWDLDRGWSRSLVLTQYFLFDFEEVVYY